MSWYHAIVLSIAHLRCDTPECSRGDGSPPRKVDFLSSVEVTLFFLFLASVFKNVVQKFLFVGTRQNGEGSHIIDWYVYVIS